MFVEKNLINAYLHEMLTEDQQWLLNGLFAKVPDLLLFFLSTNSM